MKLNYIKVFVPILVIMLACYVYASRNDEKAGDKITPLAERYSLDAGRVTGFEYTSAGGTAKLTFEKDHWQMSQPGTFPADTPAVNDFVANLLQIQPDRILEDLPPDKLAEYGLEQPTATIQFTDGSGQVALDLKIGAKTSTGSAYYATVAQDGVVLTLPVVQLEEGILSKTPNDFRSRNLFRVDREALAKIEVSYPRTGRIGYSLEKQGDGWMITAPFGYRAKERLVDATLVHLEDLKVEEFQSTPRADAGSKPEWGLAAPNVICTITNSDGTAQTVSLGDDRPLAELWATSSEMPEVFLTQQHIVAKLTWTDADIKEDRLVVFGGDTIGTVEIRLRGADNLEMEKQSDGSWQRSKPTTMTMDPEKMKSLMDALIALAPQGYLTPEEEADVDESDLGFSEYTLKLELKKTGTFKSQTLTIGKLHRVKGYFTRDSLSPGVFLLPEAAVNKLDGIVETLRGGDAPKDEQEAWSADQEAEAEVLAKDAEKDKKKSKSKKSSDAPAERNGGGLK